MSDYVDGFVLPVPKKNLAAYRKMAAKAGKIWLEHGALEFRECVGDDLKGMEGTISFTRVMKLKKGETVFFSWIKFKNRAHRDRVNKKVFADKRLGDMSDMPFDPKRMAYGGFKTLVKA